MTHLTLPPLLLGEHAWRPRRPRALDRELAGTRATAGALAGLDPAAWCVAHGVPSPGGSAARLDHVVVGPPGVLVVDSRSWPSAGAAAGVRRVDTTRRERALAEVGDTARRVAAALAGHPDDAREVPVIGVLCATPPAVVTGWIGEVLLCATSDVAAVLGRLAARLDPDEVAALARRVLGDDAATAQRGS